MGKKTNDLTQGSIGWKLLFFALPLLGSSLIQQLYNTVDLMFVGNILGKEASAAVGTCGWPINCLVGFFTGMGVGVGVLVAQAFGGKNAKQVKRIIHTAMGLVLAGSALLIAVGIALTPHVLRFMNTPENIMPLAVTYARIYFLSMFSILGYNFSSGILRALGNSRSPMIYQLIGGFANVLGNTLFIYVLDLGVAGAALATFCSQTVAALLTISHLRKLPPEYRLHLRGIRMEGEILKNILTVGIPMGVQTTLVSVSLMMLQSQINTMGVTSMAAYTAYSKMESFVYLPMWAVGQATTTFVGQNLGNGQIDRAEKGTRTALLLGIGITLCISLTLTVFSTTALRMFTREADVIELGSKIIVRLFPMYFLYVFVEVFSGAIRGAGKPAQVMLIILINMFAIRLGFLYIAMQLFDTVYEVALIFVATWITTALSVGIYYKLGSWKKPWIQQVRA